MALDDVIKGFAVMNQGLTDLAVSRASADASKQLSDLSKLNLGAEEHLKQQAVIGQQLALRLQSAGAPADQIAATANRFAASAGELQQYQLAREQQKDTEKFTHQENQLKFEQQKILQQMKLDALLGKQGQTAIKLANGFSKEFAAQPGVKDTLTGLAKYSDAQK